MQRSIDSNGGEFDPSESISSPRSRLDLMRFIYWQRDLLVYGMLCKLFWLGRNDVVIKLFEKEIHGDVMIVKLSGEDIEFVRKRFIDYSYSRVESDKEVVTSRKREHEQEQDADPVAPEQFNRDIV